MKFALIIMAMTHALNPSVSMQQITFDDANACLDAGEEAKKKFGKAEWGLKIEYVCTPKESYNGVSNTRNGKRVSGDYRRPSYRR